MPRTLFFRPATAVTRRNQLSCVWIPTGNPRFPLAQVWIEGENRQGSEPAAPDPVLCAACA